ncbi:MAG: ABC transporter substrate-binding protein [Bacteroidales bacterium]
MKKLSILLAFLMSVLLLLSTTSCEMWEEELNEPDYNNPIPIAFVGDITGMRAQGENILFGAKLAFEEINAAGGIVMNGEQHDLQPLFYDAKGDAERGKEIVEELNQKGVKFIVGPLFSSVLLGMAEEVIKNNMLLISYSATSPGITTLNDNDLIWRTCPSDAYSGRKMAEFASNDLALKKGAVLFRDDNFGVMLANIIKQEFEAQGGTITKSISYPANTLINEKYNLQETFNTLLYDRPDILFTITLSAEVANIAVDLVNTPIYRELERKPWLFVNDGVQPEEVLANAPPELSEFVYGISSADKERANYKKFKENYLARFGFIPASYAENAYDAVYLLAYAMQYQQTTSPLRVRQAIRPVANEQPGSHPIDVNEFAIAHTFLLEEREINYQGASGNLEFDSFGDPQPNVFYWTIDKGNVIRMNKNK